MQLRFLWSVIIALILSACSMDVLQAILAEDNPATTNTTPPTVQTFTSGAGCYAPVFLSSRGIEQGREVVVRVPAVTTPTNRSGGVGIRAEHTTLDEPLLLLTTGDNLTILDGPYCFATRNGENRWWHVRHEASGIIGYVDEYESWVGILHVYMDVPVQSSSLILNHFAVSIPSEFGRPAQPGETVYLSWDIAGAVNVTISREDTGEILSTAPHDVIAFVVPQSDMAEVQFVLMADAADGGRIEETRTLQIDCPDCRPTVEQTLQVEVSYQPFENGVMLYRTDTRQIYVLHNTGSVQVFADTFQGESIEISEAPPAGFLQPQLGFGKVWATEAGVRANLGWAVSPETYYSATVVLVSSDDGTDEIQLQFPDGRFIVVSGATWHFR